MESQEPAAIDRIFDFSEEPLRDLQSFATRLRDLGCMVDVDEQSRTLHVSLKASNPPDRPAVQ